MILYIMLFIFLFLSFGIKIKLRIKEEEAIVIAVFGVVILAYILGLVELLWLSTYIIGILTIISAIYVIVKLIKKQEKIKNLITLPIILYIIGMGLIYYIVKDITYAYYDEFMFWGTNLKTMLAKSCLWANAQIDGIHLIYPPFTAVAEYLFCKFNGGFHEGVTYFSINMLLFTSIMPIFKNERYHIKSLFKVIVITVITYFAITYFWYELANLCVDCILGIVFGVLMYLAYSVKDKKDYIVIAILSIAITLIKTNGILFAGIVIMQIFFKKICILLKNKKKEKILKQFLIVGLLLIIVIATYLSWQIYYTLNGKQIDDRHDKNDVSNINMKEFVNVITFNKDANNRNKLIMQNFIQGLYKAQISVRNNYNTPIIIFSAINCIYLIFIICKKEKKDAICNFFSINIGFVLYLITNLIMFMFVFQKDQGDMLMGYERYIATYMLAMTLNLTYGILEKINKKTIIFSLGFVLLLQNGIGEKFYRPIISEKTIKNANYIMEHIESTDKIYIIDQKLDYGEEFMETKFLISPIKTNLLYEWNIGNSTEGIYYKIALSEEEFVKKLVEEEYDYIYIIGISNSFLKDYQNIFTQEAKEKLKLIENKIYGTSEALLKVSTDIIK